MSSDDTELGRDVPEADALEQHTPLTPAAEAPEAAARGGDSTADTLANEADVLEQRTDVDGDDEDYPHGE